MGYDEWKTTPPDLLEPRDPCEECGELESILEWFIEESRNNRVVVSHPCTNPDKKWHARIFQIVPMDPNDPGKPIEWEVKDGAGYIALDAVKALYHEVV